MTTAVIIPTYNEIENLEELVSRIRKLRIPSLYIIVVDDNSPDGTGKLADRLAKNYKALKVIHRRGKLGLGTAYTAGFKKAAKLGAKILVTMDADLSHTPEKIPQMIKKIVNSNCDVVVGSRHMNGGKIVGFDTFRTLLSGTAQAFARHWLGLPTHDSTSGFRAYKKEVLDTIDPQSIKSQGYSYLIELVYKAHRCGFKIEEVPIVFEVRRKGKSKLSEDEIYKALQTVIRLKISKIINPKS